MHVLLLSRHGQRFVGQGRVLKEDEVSRMVSAYCRRAQHGRLILTKIGLEYVGELEVEFPVQSVSIGMEKQA